MLHHGCTLLTSLCSQVTLCLFLSGQLAILKTEAQVILGLCGLALTVTGFSGGNVIRSGSLASNFLVAGIVFIMISGTLAIFTLSHVKWITQVCGTVGDAFSKVPADPD